MTPFPSPENLKKSAANLVCLLLAAAISLGLCEIGLRYSLLRPSFRMEGMVFELDPDLLFKMRPHSRKDLNRWGYRGEDWVLRPPAGKKRIAFLGDSFVFSVNVDKEASLPAQLQKELGDAYEVLNFGVQGYGPDQSLSQLKKQGLRFHPDAVILALYPANDFNDIIRNGLYRYDDQEKRLIRLKTPVQKILGGSSLAVLWNVLKHRFDRDSARKNYYDPFNPASYRSLFMDLFADYMDFDFIDQPDSVQSGQKKVLMRGILEEVLKICASRGIPVFTVIIPSGENYGAMPLFDTLQLPQNRYFANEQAAAEVCRLAEMPFMDLRETFSFQGEKAADLYDRNDGHLSVSGYEVSASAIAGQLKSVMTLKNRGAGG